MLKNEPRGEFISSNDFFSQIINVKKELKNGVQIASCVNLFLLLPIFLSPAGTFLGS